MNDQITFVMIGALAAALQGLILWVLALIFKEIKALRDTFRQYVSHTTCAAQREANTAKLAALESRLQHLEEKK